MVRAIKILILCLLTVSGFSQVVQERNARGADRIIILKDGFRVPIRDTATAPALLNYSGDSSRGGVVYDSTLQKLCFWTGVRWVCLDDAAGPGGSSQWRDTTNGIYYNQGNVGINTVNPEYSFHVASKVGTGFKDTTITKYARAFGTTKLYLGYSGNAMRVRRSSDNAEQDIGFLSSGMLDTAAMKTFVGANDGRVVTLYDQMGGANFVQATAALQPHIIVGGAVQYINSTPALRFLWNSARMTNSSITYSAGQDRHITLSYKVDTLYNFFTALNAQNVNYGFHGGASALYWFDGTVRNFSPAFTFTDPVTVVLDSNIAIANGTSTTPTFTVPAVSGMVLGANNAGTDKVRGRVISITYEPFNFDTTIISSAAQVGSVYVFDSTNTGVLKIRNIVNQNNIFGLGIDANGTVRKTQSNIILPDSLAFQRRGRTQSINTVGWQSGYNGFVGASSAASAADSANFIWGLRAGNALTTGYRNIAMGRGALKTATTGHSLIAIGDSAMANGAVTQQGAIAIGQRALAAYVGGNVASQGAVAIGQNAGAAYNGNTNNTMVAIGLNAAANWNNTGTVSDVIAIGEGALGSATGGSANFAGQIAIGRGALSNASYTGVRNIAIGHNAGASVTSGSENVLISFGNPLTTGSRNTIINNGGAGITTGSDNMIFGFTPRVFPNTGSSTFIGSSNETAFNVGQGTVSIGGLANRSLGDFNTAVGFEALKTSGNSTAPNDEDSTTAIGYQAGSLVGSGAGTNRGAGVYIGFQAAANLTLTTATGNELIAIGVRAAGTQTAGDHNTAIGRVNLANTTGSNQLAIGGNGIGWIRQDVDGSLRRTLLNATTADVTTFTPSTALEINGTNGAVLLPRLTTAQRDALTPTNGMILYNTTTDKIQAYAGGAWVDLH
jgi:hypothetical protein